MAEAPPAAGSAKAGRSWGFHLRVGTLAAAAVLLPMLLVWYPRPLFEAAGTARLPIALAAVAVVLGPLLGFLLARAGKPLPAARLRTVAIVQCVALAGCALALYVQRPVYLVFTLDRFDLVLARDIAPQDLAKAEGEFARRPLGAPEYAAVLPPANPAEAERILGIALGGGKDLQAYPQYYVPYPQQAANALKRAKPLAQILGRDTGALRQFLESSGRAEASVRFLPLRAKRKDGAVLLDAQTGMPLHVVLIDPW